VITDSEKTASIAGRFFLEAFGMEPQMNADGRRYQKAGMEPQMNTDKHRFE
jgi:hypothetical protein